jgi:hypothetical protein
VELTPRIGGGKTTGYGQIEARYTIDLLLKPPIRHYWAH